MNRLICYTAACLTLTLSNPSVAELRCGADLIQEGDSVARMAEACGEPYTGNLDSLLQLGYGEVTYNFGRRDFMVRVRILDGKVESTETLGYGFVEDGDGPDEE